MKFTINKVIFRDCVNSIALVSKTPEAGYGIYCKISAKEGLTLQSSSARCGVFFSRSVEQGSENGECFVVSTQLRDVLSSCKSKEVSVKFDGTKLEIIDGKSKFKLNTVPSSQVQLYWPEHQACTSFDIKAEEFNSIITSLQRFRSTNANRAHIWNINVKILEGSTRFRAGDGLKFIQTFAETSSEIIDGDEFNIPPDAFFLIRELASVEEGRELSVNLPENKLVMSTEGMVAHFSLSDLKFPDLERAIPASHQTIFSVEVSEILDLIRGAINIKKIAEDFNGIVPISIALEDEKIIVKSLYDEDFSSEIQVEYKLRGKCSEYYANAIDLIEAFTLNGIRDKAEVMLNGDQDIQVVKPDVRDGKTLVLFAPVKKKKS